MSTPGNKRSPAKKVPRSGRKKPNGGTKEATSREASRIGGTSQMSGPGIKASSAALSVSAGVPKDASKKGKKKPSRRPSAVPAGTKNESTASKMDTKDEEDDEAPKKKEKKDFPKNTFQTKDGKSYTMVEHLRNPMNYGEFLIKDEKEAKYILRLEPLKRGKLQFTQEVVVETAKLFTGADKIPVIKCVDFGGNEKLQANYLLLSGYSLQLYEVLKVLKTFTPGCAFNVALQCLEAIQYLHQAGYIHRNIKPATYNIGFDDQETKVLLTDFRLARLHIEPGSTNKKVRPARPKVKYGGTSRYASVSALKEQEQSRKDDLESWIYMFYEMLDPENGLSWRTIPRCNMMIKEKENFKAHLLPNTYQKVPVEFKKLVDMVSAMTYETAPDYGAIKEIVETVGRSKNLDMTTCDWVGKFNDPAVYKSAIKQGVDKSTGNRCSGNDDFEFKKKIVRKIMNPDDVIKNGHFTWKVVNLLGSGGFGDVYKVFDVNGKDKKKHYALKTESEEGKKVMLRLKVEMQVLMAITDARKVPAKEVKESRRTDINQHFVDFVDRGKSDDLKCKFIVMSLVGPSLDDIRKKYTVKLHEKQNPYIISIQSLYAVQDLHNLGYLHRDIKPANFAVGFGPAEPTIFMLDFGIGRSYLDPATKQHRAPRKSVKFLGTLRYASRACMKGQDQGRKDDIECWFYMVHDIFDPVNGLSWKNCRKRDEITAAKDGFFNGNLKKSKSEAPSSLKDISSYMETLKFQTAPRYDYIVELLHETAEREGVNMKGGNAVGGWVGRLREKDLKARQKQAVRFSDSESEKLTESSGE
ncbi:unnamed protein product [Caenorhabditis nigoni]